ncbi:MAG TPA: PD-(D/E)XK nuclease family protein [Candidatus Methanomethylophilaceae archaeon]|nr:PD-(D/E)XK nuclease family protein [Candidatus Methanomethylophilaceae archaeon]
MYRAKSIDEIYQEVRDFDIVITNDAPLATALNGRIDRPMIGGFAYTPRQLAAELSVQILGGYVMSDLEVVATVADETGYGFKYVHGEIENIKNIRKYTSDVGKHLYSRLSRNVFQSYSALPTIEKAMDVFVPETYNEKSKLGLVISENIFSDKRTAVIGIELFDDLDKHFIPIKHEEIEIIIESEEFEIETIYEIGNDRQVAENIVDLIDVERATDIAIVMDTESGIADAVRAALYRRQIPFKNTMTVRDLSQIRDFLRFLNFAISYRTIRVRHIRELFSAYGGTIRPKHDNVLLSRLPDIGGRALELANSMKNIKEMTFEEVCDLVVRERHQPQVRMILNELKFNERTVTSQLVGEMNYAVNNVSELHHNDQIPDSEKQGVLLTDCHKSMFIDRPFVAYLGMGNEWGNKIIGKQYIDKESEAEKDAMKFRVLLQQGSSRIYAVNATKNGKIAKPTLLFEGVHEIERRSRSVVKFSDIADVKKGSWYVEEQETFPETGVEHLDNDTSKEWKFTKSTYNEYCMCPRAFYYNNLVTTPDNEWTAFGNLLHEFAEMYVCYPDVIRNKDLEYYVERIGNTYAGLSCPMMENLDLDRIRVGLRNLMAFIDSRMNEPVPLDVDNSSRKYPNALMIAEGLEKTSSFVERDSTSSVHPIFGKFDLLLDSQVIDYKTGKFKTAKDIVKGFNMDGKNYIETQPLIYLALMRDSGISVTGTFGLFYLFGTDGRVKDETSVRDCTVDVKLLRETKSEAIRGQDSPVRESFNNVKAYVEMYDDWDSFVLPIIESGLPPEEWITNDSLINGIISSLGLKPLKKTTEKVIGALKKLYKIIIEDYWASGGMVLVPSDSMDKFLEKLDKDHSEASIMMNSKFPAKPIKDCEKCGFASICTREPVSVDEGGDEYDQ